MSKVLICLFDSYLQVTTPPKNPRNIIPKILVFHKFGDLYMDLWILPEFPLLKYVLKMDILLHFPS